MDLAQKLYKYCPKEWKKEASKVSGEVLHGELTALRPPLSPAQVTVPAQLRGAGGEERVLGGGEEGECANQTPRGLGGRHPRATTCPSWGPILYINFFPSDFFHPSFPCISAEFQLKFFSFFFSDLKSSILFFFPFFPFFLFPFFVSFFCFHFLFPFFIFFPFPKAPFNHFQCSLHGELGAKAPVLLLGLAKGTERDGRGTAARGKVVSDPLGVSNPTSTFFKSKSPLF